MENNFKPETKKESIVPLENISENRKGIIKNDYTINITGHIGTINPNFNSMWHDDSNEEKPMPHEDVLKGIAEGVENVSEEWFQEAVNIVKKRFNGYGGSIDVGIIPFKDGYIQGYKASRHDNSPVYAIVGERMGKNIGIPVGNTPLVYALYGKIYVFKKNKEGEWSNAQVTEASS